MYVYSLKNILVLFSVLALSQAFAPATRPPAFTATQLQMGLFDFMQPKKKPAAAKSGEMDKDVFGGKGARITIREDEDAAMWIEEPKDKKGKKKGGK